MVPGKKTPMYKKINKIGLIVVLHWFQARNNQERYISNGKHYLHNLHKFQVKKHRYIKK